jgi:hypothetical protein
VATPVSPLAFPTSRVALDLGKGQKLALPLSGSATDQSLAAVHDEPVAQVVRRDSDAHAIPGEHANVMPPHPTAELCANDGTTLVNLDVVLPTTESVLYDAFHFEKITFTHVACAFS